MDDQPPPYPVIAEVIRETTLPTVTLTNITVNQVSFFYFSSFLLKWHETCFVSSALNSCNNYQVVVKVVDKFVLTNMMNIRNMRSYQIIHTLGRNILKITYLLLYLEYVLSVCFTSSIVFLNEYSSKKPLKW